MFATARQATPRLRLTGLAIMIALLSIIDIAQPKSAHAAYQSGEKVIVEVHSLNVRDEPGLHGAVVDTLSQGTEWLVHDGPVYADGYTWYFGSPDAPGQSGWFASEFVSPSVHVPTTQAFSIGTPVFVNTDYLNLRTFTSLSAPVVATMPYGTEAMVTTVALSGDGYIWYGLDTPYGGGFAAAAFLGQYHAPTGSYFVHGTTAMVATDYLNMRGGAGFGWSAFTTLPYGATTTILWGPEITDGYTWYRVSSNYGTGWVAG